MATSLDLHEYGAQCLEDFRKIFASHSKDNYALTLIARDRTRPDGSRDVLITEDSQDGISQAIMLRFQPLSPKAGAEARRKAP